MTLNNITYSKVGNKNRVIYSFTDYKRKKNTLWVEYDSQESYSTLNASSFVLALLLISMKYNSDINCSEYEISAELAQNLDLIQSKLIELFPELNLSKIKINAQISDSLNNKSRKRVGTFFTGGVDSFYVLLAEKSINSLIYVIGFDVKENDKTLQSIVLPAIKEISEQKKLNLDIVRTNLRELTEDHFSWEYVYGISLGAVANLFSNYKKIYIPSSLDLENQTADGSHSELDYLYSNESVEILNCGLDKNRIMKVRTIVEQEPLVRKYLRVCWKNVNNTYNCGVCEKCVRTKMELDSLGGLQDIESFSNKKISPYIKSLKIKSKVIAHYYKEIEKELSKGDYPYLNELRKKIDEFDSSRRSSELVVDVFEGKKKNILFIDFNGVISFNPFWNTISDPKHKYNKYYNQIEENIFRGDKNLVLSWMLGNLTTEEVHKQLQVALHIPKKEINEIENIFIEDCKNLDISEKVLGKLLVLKKFYHILLVTDNMDTFSRFTLPNHTILNKVFDEIHDSYIRGSFKKSDNGKLFKEASDRYNVPIEYCTYIDDSKNNCACFSELGGKVFIPKNELEVLEALDEILADVTSKWEWQY